MHSITGVRTNRFGAVRPCVITGLTHSNRHLGEETSSYFPVITDFGRTGKAASKANACNGSDAAAGEEHR